MDEEQIDNMSMLFFEDVLFELGKKLNYDAIVNYAGNSFCEKSWKMIQDSNPMLDNHKTGTSAVAAFFENATIVKKGQEINPEALGPIKERGKNDG